MKKTQKWKYKSTMLFVLTLIVLFLFADTEIARTLIKQIGSYGYLGAFITGIFFVSTFTVVPATIVLLYLAQEFSPIFIAVCSGAGSVIGDLLIFRFLRDGVFEEIRPFFSRFKNSYFTRLTRSSHFSWLLPVIGAIIIASPFPDEIGVGLMGLSKIKQWQFAILALILNTAGIFAIITIIGKL